MVLDILIRHVPSTVHVTVGRSFYTTEGKQVLPNAAEVWQGYYQSARPTYGNATNSTFCIPIIPNIPLYFFP